MMYELLFSATGRTEKVLDIVSGQWNEKKERIDLSDINFDRERYDFTENDMCIVAVSVYGGRVPAPAVEKLKKLKGNGAKAIMIAVFGNRAIDDALIELKDILVKAGFIPFAAMESSVQHSIMPQVEPDRPDNTDRAELISFAEKIKALLESEKELSVADVPGNYPYKEMGSLPFSPKADKKCNSCGLCVTKCPVGAISADNPKATDKDKCITCMRCVEICPSHARSLPELLLKGAYTMLKHEFVERKPNKLYIAE